MSYSALILGILLGLLPGLLLFFWRHGQLQQARTRLEELATQLTATHQAQLELSQQAAALQASSEGRQAQLELAQKALEAARTQQLERSQQVAALQVKVENLQQQLQGLAQAEQALEEARQQKLSLTQQATGLQADNRNLREQLERQQQQQREAAAQLTVQFKNLASEILEDKSRRFTVQNKEQIGALLSPLEEKIGRFEAQIARTQREAADRNIALRSELEHITKLNLQMTREAENLTKAIKGDTKVQGNWGEFILESLLEKSGLTKDREYFIQESFLTEDGKRYQPDVVIKLPEGKSIVIDAKVSLIHYERCFNSSDAAEQARYAKQHLQSVRNHIKILSAKNYAHHYNLKGLDFVLMFVPLEPAFAMAIQHAPELFNEAYQQNIVLVAPSTLLATLRTISYVWKSEYQNQNALQIADDAGKLYDKFADLVKELTKLGNQLATPQKTYEGIMKKLSEGRGNLLSRAQKIQALGARTSKQLALQPTE